MVFSLQIIFTYIGGDILKVVPLTIQEWSIITFFAAAIFPIDIIRKLIWGQIYGEGHRI